MGLWDLLYARSQEEVKDSSAVSRRERNIFINIAVGNWRDSVLFLWNLYLWESFGGMLAKWRVSLTKHNA